MPPQVVPRRHCFQVAAVVVLGVVVDVVDVVWSEGKVRVQVGPQLSVEPELPAIQPTACKLQVPVPMCDRVDLVGDGVGGCSWMCSGLP